MSRFKGQQIRVTRSKNLFNKATVTNGFFVNPANGIPGASGASNASDFIPVQPSTSYVKNTRGSVCFYTSARVFISGIADTVAIAGYSFTTPANCAFIRISIMSYGGTANNRTLFTQVELGTKVTAYEKYGSVIDGNDLPTIPGGRDNRLSRYYDKYVTTLGDSITNDTLYQQALATKLGVRWDEFGEPGTKLADKTGADTTAMVNRYTAMTGSSTVDIVIAMGGSNDYTGDVPMGVDGSSDKTTFKGALKVLIEGLLNQYPGKIIIFMTPPPRYTGDSFDTQNGLGLKLIDYVNAIKSVCQSYAIPVVDNYSNCGINSINKSLYMPDGIHPNADGHDKISNLIISTLASI